MLKSVFISYAALLLVSMSSFSQHEAVVEANGIDWKITRDKDGNTVSVEDDGNRECLTIITNSDEGSTTRQYGNCN